MKYKVLVTLQNGKCEITNTKTQTRKNQIRKTKHIKTKH